MNVIFGCLFAASTKYSETCVRKPPLRLTLVVDVERWLSYKGTCHVILLAMTSTFIRQPPFHINPHC